MISLLFSSLGWRAALRPTSSRLVARHGLVTASVARKRVVFLGTPACAARSLELLLAASAEGRGGGFDVAAVVSNPPARSGRKMKLTPSPVHALAEERGVRLLTPPNAKDEEFLTTLAELQPDLCVTAAYGCFLPQRFLDLPAHGTLNVHPSLLPLYRGAAPLQRCLEAGDAVGGVTVAFTVLKMDAGPVLRQVERDLSGNEQFPELLIELFETGTEQLIDALPSVWDDSCQATLRPQDGDAATAAKKVQKEEAELDLASLSAQQAHSRTRAFAGWPGTWCWLQVGDAPPAKAKLGRTRVGPAGAPPSSRTLELGPKGEALRLPLADGSVLEVLQLTMAGKKTLQAKAFWNGLNGRPVQWLSSAEAEAATPDAA